jgi:hypothetical protein
MPMARGLGDAREHLLHRGFDVVNDLAILRDCPKDTVYRVLPLGRSSVLGLRIGSNGVPSNILQARSQTGIIEHWR